MIPVSIVIITLNEEKNIKRCLDSVIDISDDIIVVDSGSKDRTVEICKTYKNLRPFENKFIDYSQQRNFGTSLSKYNYILNIDADECLSNELKNSILNLKIDDNENIVYSFNRLNHYCGKPIKYSGFYPDIKRKFWNKNYAEWKGKVHETLDFKETPKHIKLKGDLLHYTYNSEKEHITQSIKYAIIGAEADLENNKKPSIIKLIFKPYFKFLFIYFIKLGVLDGRYGYMIAKLSAFTDFVKQAILFRKN